MQLSPSERARIIDAFSKSAKENAFAETKYGPLADKTYSRMYRFYSKLSDGQLISLNKENQTAQ